MIVWGLTMEQIEAAADSVGLDYRLDGHATAGEGLIVQPVSREGGRYWKDNPSRGGVCVHGHAALIDALLHLGPHGKVIVKTGPSLYRDLMEYEEWVRAGRQAKLFRVFERRERCECPERQGGDMSVIDASVVH